MIREFLFGLEIKKDLIFDASGAETIDQLAEAMVLSGSEGPLYITENLYMVALQSNLIHKLVGDSANTITGEQRISEACASTLTRDQAIKRIEDIRQGVEIDHHKPNGLEPFWSMHTQGAIMELMAIFDIKEEELK